MVPVTWKPQTADAWDPLSTVFTMKIRVGGVTLDVEGVFDTGADMIDLQPPKLAEFQINADQHGFSTTVINGQKWMIPIVIAEAELDGHWFEVPVALYPFDTRPVHVFGRAGLLDHFKVTLDPAAGQTRFEWNGKGPHSRIEAIKQEFVDPLIGKRQLFLAAGYK